MKKPKRFCEAKKRLIELFISDVHVPFQDKAAWNLTLEVIKRIKPEIIFIGGDFLDCYAVSRFDKDPSRKLTLQQDLNMACAELAKVRDRAPNADIRFLQGNHETRMVRYLHSKAEELSVLDALHLGSLLKLHQFEIKWIPNGTRHRIGKLWHLHGNEIPGGGVFAARSKFMKLQANIIFGHHHVTQFYTGRDYEDKTRGAWANGCLCDLSPEYAHFTQWNHSISIIEYAKSGTFQVEQIPLLKRGKLAAYCMIRGKSFEADTSSKKPLIKAA